MAKKRKSNTTQTRWKTIASVALLIAGGVVLLAVFGLRTTTGKDSVKIREKMFMTQVHEIHLNAGRYLGKTIQLEGLFIQQQADGLPTQKVYRRTILDACCGIYGMSGFEVAWVENRGQPYPAPDSWVEAVGVLRNRGNDSQLYLDLISLTILDRRGLEFVTR